MTDKLKTLGIPLLITCLSCNTNTLAQENKPKQRTFNESLWYDILKKDYTKEQAREILSDPDKFLAEYDKHTIADITKIKAKDGSIEKYARRDPRISSAWLARELLHTIKGENDFLKKLVDMYLEYEEKHKQDPGYMEISDAFIPCCAIRNMTPGDDAYFQKLLDTKDSYHIQLEALNKMPDEKKIPLIISGLDDYGKNIRVIEKHPGELHYFESLEYFVARDALLSVNDISFLEETANRKDLGEMAIFCAEERLRQLRSKGE